MGSKAGVAGTANAAAAAPAVRFEHSGSWAPIHRSLLAVKDLSDSSDDDINEKADSNSNAVAPGGFAWSCCLSTIKAGQGCVMRQN